MIKPTFPTVHLPNPVPSHARAWLSRYRGPLAVWAVVTALVTGLGGTILHEWNDHTAANPEYGQTHYTVKEGDSASLICAKERPTMGLDTCLNEVLHTNLDLLDDGFTAGEVIMLPDGR